MPLILGLFSLRIRCESFSKKTSLGRLSEPLVVLDKFVSNLACNSKAKPSLTAFNALISLLSLANLSFKPLSFFSFSSSVASKMRFSLSLNESELAFFSALIFFARA